MTCTRRQLFQGRWSQKEVQSAAKTLKPNAAESGTFSELPSDFGPAFLKMQAKLMGLDVEHLSSEEIADTVLAALNGQKKPQNESDQASAEKGTS